MLKFFQSAPFRRRVSPLLRTLGLPSRNGALVLPRTERLDRVSGQNWVRPSSPSNGGAVMELAHWLRLNSRPQGTANSPSWDEPPVSARRGQTISVTRKEAPGKEGEGGEWAHPISCSGHYEVHRSSCPFRIRAAQRRCWC